MAGWGGDGETCARTLESRIGAPARIIAAIKCLRASSGTVRGAGVAHKNKNVLAKILYNNRPRRANLSCAIGGSVKAWKCYLLIFRDDGKENKNAKIRE